MNISYPSASALTTTGAVVTNVNASTTSLTISAANPTRLLGGMIINNSNKRLWIRFDALAATTAVPCIPVPASGGSIDIPDGFIGQITGIWEAGATLNCQVIEFNA